MFSETGRTISAAGDEVLGLPGFAANPRKLEHGLSMRNAQIPSSLLYGRA